jgi:hypothetical protein
MTRDPVAPVARNTCDLCGGARERSERHRLVWDTGLGTELVLADCADAAPNAPAACSRFTAVAATMP